MKLFGENVQGYNIPVLNEREIRASAGILFLFLIVAFMFAVLEMNFTLLKYFIVFFLADFACRIFINPKYSPTLILGRLIVSRQTPEYVGAAQKKFSWIIGLTLATIMFVHMVVFNSYSYITGIICMICLIFLFFETAFGICLGCYFYKLFYKKNAQYCPGEICDVRKKEEIQKTSNKQIMFLLIFLTVIFLSIYFMSDRFNQRPYELFANDGTEQTK